MSEIKWKLENPPKYCNFLPRGKEKVLIITTSALGCPRNSIDTEFRLFYLLPSIP